MVKSGYECKDRVSFSRGFGTYCIPNYECSKIEATKKLPTTVVDQSTSNTRTKFSQCNDIDSALCLLNFKRGYCDIHSIQNLCPLSCNKCRVTTTVGPTIASTIITTTPDLTRSFFRYHECETTDYGYI